MKKMPGIFVIIAVIFPFYIYAGDLSGGKISDFLNGLSWHGFYTFHLVLDGKNIYFDPNPIENSLNFSSAEYHTADIIFISHDNSHQGDQDVKSSIDILTNSNTVIIMPKLEALYLTNKTPFYMVKGLLPGEKAGLGGIEIEAVPAYDVILKNIAVADHPKSNNWIGYIINVNGIRVYYTGASQLVPEMMNVRCDILMSNLFLKPGDVSVLATLAEWTGARILIPMGYASGGMFTPELDKVERALKGKCSIFIPEIRP
jgi:L-ascorbate metabolism protein UlaG (beta-lactamase superfamily)